MKVKLAVDSRDMSVAEAAFRRGRVSLVDSEWQLAINELAAAAAHSADDAAIWNDLAAAYLTRHVVEERAWDLVEALDAAQRAVGLAPDSPDTNFNYALSLSLFSLRRQAKTAWEHYFEIERDPAWIEEAQVYFQDATRPRPADLWEKERVRLEALAAGSSEVDFDEALDADIESVVDEYPFLSRLWLEEDLLGRWARAAEQDDEEGAERLLRLAGSAARGLAAARGEHMPLAIVRAIQDARHDAERWGGLVRAHTEFAEAIASYRKQEFSGVEEGFGRAEEGFRRFGSPMALWACFYRTICVYYRDPVLAEQEFLVLESDLNRALQPTLLGQVKLMIGLSLGVRTTGSDRELAYYSDALAILLPASGSRGSSLVQILLAETLGPLGEVEASWAYKIKAFGALGASGLARQEHPLWLEAAKDLQRRERPSVAMPFLFELAATATEWQDHPYAVAEARAQMAWNLMDLGQADEAAIEINRSRQALAQLDQPGDVGLRLEAWLELFEATGSVELDPVAALAKFERSLRTLDQQNWLFERPRFLAAKARANRLLGDDLTAENELRRAVDLWHATASGIADQELSLAAFSAEQPVIEELADLLLTEGDDVGALEVVEMARTRFLSRRYEELVPAGDLVGRLQAALTADTVLLEYLVLGDRVMAWVISGNSARSVRLNVDREDLEKRVAVLLRDLNRRADDEVLLPQLDALHGDLIAPLDLPTAKRLAVVPDLWLSGVPFAALHDLTAGWLNERYAIALSPTSTVLLLKNRFKDPNPGMGKLLVVAQSYEGEAPAGMQLSTLGWTRKEAEAFGGFYPDSEVIVDLHLTGEELLRMMAGASVFHFAGHAESNEEAFGRSKLWLDSDEAERQSYLQVADLWESDLSGLDIAILSACDTAVSTSVGRAGLFGLAGGFLYAGVKQTVGSQWRTDDKANFRIMYHFHEHYSEMQDAAEALRQARRESLNDGDRIADWSAYSVIGIR